MLSINAMTRDASDRKSGYDQIEKLFNPAGSPNARWWETQTDAFVATIIGCPPWARTAEHRLNNKLSIRKRHLPRQRTLANNGMAGIQYDEVLKDLDSDEEMDGSSTGTISDSDSSDNSSEESLGSKIWEVDSEGIPVPSE